MEQAIYLFCLARNDLLPELQGTGICEGKTLFRETFDHITAVACDVPLDEFVGSAAEERLRDLAWVAPRAVRHGEVLDEAMCHSPVFPAQFGTLFSSRQSLLRFIEINYGEISEFLGHVEDKEEWAVKIFVSESDAKKRLLSEKQAAEFENLESLSPGLRYFKQKQWEADVEKQTRAWIRSVSRAVAESLGELAVESLKRKVVIGLHRDDQVKHVASWAYLLARSRFDHFQEKIDRVNREYAGQGLSVEISGPWPPYSFAPSLVPDAMPEESSLG